MSILPRPLTAIKSEAVSPDVRRVLADIRRRYHLTHPTERPALYDPISLVGCVPVRELTILAAHGNWPLPPHALSWIATSPGERARQRSKRRRVIDDVVCDILEQELPAAVELLTGKVDQ
jgi:hypothetical protein